MRPGLDSDVAGVTMEDSLIGTWILVSAIMEDIETRERQHFWGQKPRGRLVITQDRWIVLQTAEDRKIPLTDEDRTAAFKSMIAYSGSFRTEESKIIIKVDIAWDESWIATEQVRSFRIDGDNLHIDAAPQPYANFGGRVMRGILVWRREGRASN
jgi:lipocalin-like protein